jgi:hypothetical protein
VQTFLPLPEFDASARCLDRQRLGKQRLEVMWIHKALTGGRTRGRIHHPATIMWRGYERALAAYGLACCLEWTVRGYEDNLGVYFAAYLAAYLSATPGRFTAPLEMPLWFGDDRFHASHRSNLLRKNPEHYGQFGWTEPHDLPYYWPGAAQ